MAVITVNSEKLAVARAKAVRVERDRLLAACDWTAVTDSPLSAEAKTAWATYRQALRDIPAQSTFPISVTWPTAPDMQTG